jgi:hypothetical protein
MVGGHYEEIARAIHRSANLVYRWTLPTADYSEAGAFNDLDRLRSGMREALDLGVSPVDALAPVHFLALSFGGLFLPPVPHACQLNDISRQLARAMAKVGEAFAVAAKALEDDELTPNERREILTAAHNGLHEFTALIGLVEAGREG